MSHPLASRCALLTLAIVCGAAVSRPDSEARQSPMRGTAVAAGEDSPWPRTKALGPNVRAARRELARLERQVELMEQSAENAEDWMTCIKYVPVNEQGDRDRQSGYLYDERDGTGPGSWMASQWTGAAAAAERTTCSCTSAVTAAGATTPSPAGPRSPHRRGPRAPQAPSPRPRRTADVLERKAERLSERSQRLETISERFDEWESCVSWVPVTELGDPDQRFGYLFGLQGEPGGIQGGAAHRPRRLGRPGLHVPRARRG